MNKRLFKLFFIIFTFLFVFNKNIYAEEVGINDTITEEEIVEEKTTEEDTNVEQNTEIIETNDDLKYQLIIEDDANLLSNDEIVMLKEKMKPLLDFGNIAFKTIDKNPFSSADSYARDYYHNKFNMESGTLLLIDMDTRNIYIFSDGYNYNIITRDKAYIITDNVYQYATNERYYRCAYEAFDQINKLLNGGKILEPMRYASNIVISITLGAFVAFFIAVKMTSSKKVSEKEILKMMNSHLILNSIEATKKTPQSSGVFFVIPIIKSNLNQRNIVLVASFAHVVGPDAGLDFANMSLAQEEHAEP